MKVDTNALRNVYCPDDSDERLARAAADELERLRTDLADIGEAFLDYVEYAEPYFHAGQGCPQTNDGKHHWEPKHDGHRWMLWCRQCGEERDLAAELDALDKLRSTLIEWIRSEDKMVEVVNATEDPIAEDSPAHKACIDWMEKDGGLRTLVRELIDETGDE